MKTSRCIIFFTFHNNSLPNSIYFKVPFNVVINEFYNFNVKIFVYHATGLLRGKRKIRAELKHEYNQSALGLASKTHTKKLFCPFLTDKGLQCLFTRSIIQNIS